MGVIYEDSVSKWKEKLGMILSQHIYKQNDALKKIQLLSEELLNTIIVSGISYRELCRERTIDLYEHMIFTAILSLETGMCMGLEEEILKNISFGCLLHDMGLRFINVSFKNRDLKDMSAKEVFEFKKHTILGYTSIEQEKWIPEAVKLMVLSHHENMDGSGYPLKQKNKEIECKIIQVCDSVDRIISGIGGKRGTMEEAREEIGSNCDKKYDPKVSEVVLDLI